MIGALYEDSPQLVLLIIANHQSGNGLSVAYEFSLACSFISIGFKAITDWVTSDSAIDFPYWPDDEGVSRKLYQLFLICALVFTAPLVVYIMYVNPIKKKN